MKKGCKRRSLRQEESLNSRGTKASWSRREEEARTGMDWESLRRSVAVLHLVCDLNKRSAVDRSFWSVGDGRGSGTVSHDDEGGQEFAQLGSRDGPSFGLAASLPAPGQLGVGGRRERHGGAGGRHHERAVLLLVLVLHAVLLSQLPVHSHDLVGEESQVPGTAGSAVQRKRHVMKSDENGFKLKQMFCSQL